MLKNNSGFEYYSKAVSESPYDADALNGLAECLFYGIGVEPDEAKGRSMFEIAAKLGSENANYNLGNICFLSGSINEAFDYFKKAADCGCTEAYEHLGNICDSKGEHVEAAGYYREASKYGSSKAMFRLAEYYRNGKGVNPNPKSAHEFYEKAAESGNEDAQYETAYDYDFGIGTSVDKAKAVLWYETALKNGNIKAGVRLGALLSESKDESEQLRGTELLKNAAEANDSDALLKLGNIYYFGLNSQRKNEAAAIECWSKGSQLKNSKCTYMLAGINNDSELMFRAGENGCSDAWVWLGRAEQKKGNFRSAYNFYSKAYEADNASSAFRLAEMFRNGAGVERDIRKAFEMYKYAAEKGNAYAMFELGVCYTDGLCTPQNLELASFWLNSAEKELSNNNKCLFKEEKQYSDFKLATLYDYRHKYDSAFFVWKELAEKKDPNAQFNTGLYYYFGKGVNKDIDRAIYWWKAAAENGNRAAADNLRKLNVSEV